MEKEKESVSINFNEMIKGIEKEVNEEIEVSKEIAEETLNEKTKIKQGIMSKIWSCIVLKLFNRFKVKITLYYDNKVVFEYEIPKN